MPSGASASLHFRFPRFGPAACRTCGSDRNGPAPTPPAYFHMSSPVCLAVAAHPDDVEFWMAGTMLLLQKAGWELHYMNLSSGSLGSTVMTVAQTKTARRKEAREAARLLGATWHPPISNDMEILYSLPLLRKLAAVMREVRPTVVLTHPPQDYMEDHTETCRLAVSAAFTMGFPNYVTVPARPPVHQPVTVYHCMPHTLHDPLGQPVAAGAWVDTTSVIDQKTAALAAHNSQRLWLDETQGMDSYTRTMQEFSLEAGRRSGCFQHAEGWRKHLHAGFCSSEADPLATALGDLYTVPRSSRKK